MKTSIIYGLFASLVCFVLMYLDSKLFDEPRTKTTYLKNMAMVGGIIAFGIHSIGEANFNKAIGMSSSNVTLMGDLGEQIATGEPNF